MAAQSLGIPFTPGRDSVVLETVPAGTDPRVTRFERLAAQHAREPSNRATAIELSQSYIDYARATGDARFLGRALVPIQPWLNQTPVAPDVLIVQATVLQSRHEFDRARALLQTALKRDPGNAQGWLTLATVDMVEGDFDAARSDCVQTTNTGGQYLGIVCNGALLSLTGRSPQAYKLLGVIALQTHNVPIEMQAYVQGLMADAAARQGDTDRAETHYQDALALTPGDNFLLDHYADLLLDENRPADALALVTDYTASDTLFLRAALAKNALDAPDADAAIKTMAERFEAMAERGSHVYRREQARFVLELQHEPARALGIALENWKTQRAPEDVRILLASALAADQPGAAEPALDFLDHTHMSAPPIDALASRLRAELPSPAPTPTSSKDS